jgi:GNAT superfamily N-acetyltransferase
VIDVLVRPDQLDGPDRRGLVDCWVAVTNAGGAVGFPFPPVGVAEVAPAVDELASELDPDRCVLFRSRSDGAVQGWVVLRRSTSYLVSHWATVERLQTLPQCRGRGIARDLMASLEGYARDELGVEQLRLAARGGLGLEGYYEAQGWREVGRWPRALRLAADDVRDEVLMAKALGTPPVVDAD